MSGSGSLVPELPAESAVAGAADDPGVVEVVLAALCVGDDVVGFGAVGLPCLLVVEGHVAQEACGLALFVCSCECLASDESPCWCRCP